MPDTTVKTTLQKTCFMGLVHQKLTKLLVEMANKTGLKGADQPEL